MTRGMLFSQMSPPPELVDEFHDWYETEHIPARMAISGFRSAARYRLEGGSDDYLAVYFIDDLAALDTPEYRALKDEPSPRTDLMLKSVSGFTRYITEEISDTGVVDPEGSGALFVVAFAVPDSDADEFKGWYEEEHVPLLMKVPGWRRVRRYRSRPGSAGHPWTHFALHELDSPAVMDAPEREAARNTPRRDALAGRDWFGSGRWLYRPIHFAHAATTKEQ